MKPWPWLRPRAGRPPWPTRLRTRWHTVKLGWNWRRLLLWAGLVSLLLTLVAVGILVAAGTTYLQVEARSGVVEIEFSPGAPIAWSLDAAQLLECKALRDEVARSAAQAPAAASSAPPAGTHVLGDLESIEINARHDKASGVQDTVQADLVVVDGAPVIELRGVQRKAGMAPASTGGCDAAPSTAAVLDAGDGTRRGLQLPAQLRLPAQALGDGLTLEFRGSLRIGRDVTSSRQPLLASGRLVMREVRARWLQGLVTSPHFEIEGRELGLGDKLTLHALDADGASPMAQGDAPQGFVRLVPGERGIDMSVSATAQAARAEIVRPFSRAETPQANLIKVASRDDLVQLLFGLLGALWGMGFSIYSVLQSGPAAPDGNVREPKP